MLSNTTAVKSEDHGSGPALSTPANSTGGPWSHPPFNHGCVHTVQMFRLVPCTGDPGSLLPGLNGWGTYPEPQFTHV